jgi:two-component system chemotaxis response regulator CheY
MWLQAAGARTCSRPATVSPPAKARLEAEPVDVLVSDVNMPGLDGLELVEADPAEHGGVRKGVIVLTNRWDHVEIRDRLSEWGVHVLPKPFSPHKLSELVENLTEAGAGEKQG